MQQKLKSEDEIIQELTILFEVEGDRIGIGDDAAVLEYHQLLSVDAVVEGVHFLKEKASWDDVAYKLFAGSASDMAAMGGYVTGYLLSLGIPYYWDNNDLHVFIQGIKEFIHEFPADLLGGDIVRSKEFFGSVTVLGKTFTKPWLRTSAKPGDFIYVTGTLGDSRLYLQHELKKNILPMKDLTYFKQRHYRPTPRIDWAQEINKKYRIHAAMDISDGLIEDLNKLCRLSGVHFYVDANLLPLSTAFIGEENVSEHKIFYQHNALIGGEDYELIVITDEIIDEDTLLEQGVKITRIGRILTEEEISIVLWNNKRYTSNEFQGYRHS